ncbi:MAG: hypothetical protein ACP5D4_19710 [Baaleninema sp.]
MFDPLFSCVPTVDVDRFSDKLFAATSNGVRSHRYLYYRISSAEGLSKTTERHH